MFKGTLLGKNNGNQGSKLFVITHRIHNHDLRHKAILKEIIINNHI